MLVPRRVNPSIFFETGTFRDEGNLTVIQLLAD